MGKHYATWLVLLTVAPGFSGATSASAPKPGGAAIISADADGHLRVEAHELPRAQVIEALAKGNDMQVHFIAVPDAQLTVTCTARDLERLFACVVGNDANLIFGYPTPGSQLGVRGTPNKVWVLSNRTGKEISPNAPKTVDFGAEMSADEPTGAVPPPAEQLDQTSSDTTAIAAERALSETPIEDGHDWADVLPARDAADATADAAATPMLIDLANSTDTVDRMQALAGLAIDGPKNDPGVSATLEVALNDVHPAVRAQAVHALLVRDGPRSAAFIEAALRDENPDVRLMVVESAGSHPGAQAWLRRALTDTDATVRELAAAKLKEAAPAAPTAHSTLR